MTLARILVFVLAAVAPVVTWAQCACGFGDGRFTLAPINVNGNMADWAPVHADLDNNVCDGPSGGLIDRDAPVQSTGRDLTHFAYTWDANNIYLYTARVGSASNTQSFVYYADIDNDALMETGEPVIGVTWQGSNRRINVYLFTYVSSAPGGDPMVDGNGFGDGYTLPGSFANVPSTGNPNRSGIWGSANGLEMEFFITWAELGVAPGSPFTFHVASSNASLGASSFTAQVDDNLSGCGGGLGSTVIPGVDLTPDRALSGGAGQSVVGVHTLTNTGNDNDSYDFTSSITGDFTPTLNYYEDTDGSGTLTAGDTLLTDTDGDGDPDIGPLAPTATATILIEYTIPGSAADGESATVTTTAASDFRPLVTSSVTDTIAVIPMPDLVVAKTVRTVSDPFNLGSNPKAIPGGVVEYAVQIRNEGPGTVDADTVEVMDAIPNNGCMLVSDIGAPGSGPVDFQDGTPSSNLTYSFVSLASSTDDIAFSDDGGMTFGYTPTAGPDGCDAAVSHILLNPKGIFAGDSGSGAPQLEFRFNVQVN